MSADASRIRDTLASSNPKAVRLFDELCQYFKCDLQFKLASEPHSSVEYIKKPAESFCEIVVTVRLSPPAIVHELLHLKLNKNGFPIPLPRSVFEYSEAAELGNAISHTLFVDEFRSYGFDAKDFFFERGAPNDLGKIKKEFNRFRDEAQSSPYARGAWNRLYFAQWVAREMGFPNQTDDYLGIGQTWFATMSADANWIEAWFNRRDFCRPEKYASAITEFMTQFGLPAATFVRIEPIGGRIQLV